MSRILNSIKWLSCCTILMLIPILLQSCVGSSKVSVPYDSQYSFGTEAFDTSGLAIILETADPKIDTLAADPENQLLLKVQVRDRYGRNAEGVRVRMEISGTPRPDPVLSDKDFSSDNPSEIIGILISDTGLSGAGGAFYTAYSPPGILYNNISYVKITAYIEGTKTSSSLTIKLVPVPVVLIHGYQAAYSIFSGLTGYLQMQGFDTSGYDYNSRTGIAAGAEALSTYLDNKKEELAASGIQAERFDLISHSMGGLVARYYTCSEEYVQRSDVRKLIFISVPQKGSHFAALGQQYFNDASVRDMSSGSELFTFVFPGMINEGVNPSIQTASILGMYDEVVNAANADLTGWGIDTEIYEVGENNLTVEKILTGEILGAQNHKLILYNGKIFNIIVEMLKTNLPFPTTIK